MGVGLLEFKRIRHKRNRTEEGCLCGFSAACRVIVLRECDNVRVLTIVDVIDPECPLTLTALQFLAVCGTEVKVVRSRSSVAVALCVVIHRIAVNLILGTWSRESLTSVEYE